MLPAELLSNLFTANTRPGLVVEGLSKTATCISGSQKLQVPSVNSPQHQQIS